MYQNYNYYPQQMPQQQPQGAAQTAALSQNYYVRPQPATGLKGRPVASLEEARATSIDFDGSIFFFPDLANRRIYTKQINMDGTATLNMYELKEMPSEPKEPAYITRDEFEQVITQLQEAIKKSPPVQKPVREEIKQF